MDGERGLITFFVRGHPVPKGSMIARKVNGTAYPVDVNKNRLDYWQELIASAGTYVMQQRGEAGIYVGALRVHLVFHYIKPKTVKRIHPTAEPDSDKLARAALDALTGPVFKNDAQVVTLWAQKVYAQDEGVWIQVEPLEEMVGSATPVVKTKRKIRSV